MDLSCSRGVDAVARAVAAATNHVWGCSVGQSLETWEPTLVCPRCVVQQPRRGATSPTALVVMTANAVTTATAREDARFSGCL